MTGVTLCAREVGHRVPRDAFTGRVHSTFMAAVNVVGDGDALATVATWPLAAGPSTIVVDAGALDLRALFSPEEAVVLRAGALCAGRARIVLQGAAMTRPVPRRPTLPGAALRTRRERARVWVRAMRVGKPSVVAGSADAVLARLVVAAADQTQPDECVRRLVGWGEGLTPACDDFLVGFIAGLDWLAGDDAQRAWLARLCAEVCLHLARTTLVSAHALRLAAAGEYGVALERARNALYCEPDWASALPALGDLASVGASSGVDSLSGLVAALQAWGGVMMKARAA